MSRLPTWLSGAQVYPDVIYHMTLHIDETIEKLSTILANFHASSEAALRSSASGAAASASSAPRSPAGKAASPAPSAPAAQERPWEGLDSEGRAAFAALARERVEGISADLARARAFLASLAIADVKELDLAAGLRAGRAELVRLGKLVAALPPVPGAPLYAAPAVPPELPPLSPRSAASAALAATPLATAQLCLEAYREGLVRTVDLLEAAAEGRSSLPSSNVLGALEATCATVYSAELRLKEALQACSERCKRAEVTVAPLARALGVAQAEARARAASLSARVGDLDTALGSAREALHTVRAAGARPVPLQALLSLSKTLAAPLPGGGGAKSPAAADAPASSAAAAPTSPSAAQIASSLTARLHSLHAGKGGEDGVVQLGGSQVLLRDLQVGREEAAPQGGGEGSGAGAGAGGGGAMEVEDVYAASAAAAAAAASSSTSAPSAFSPSAAAPAPAPAPEVKLSLSSAILSLNPTQRAQLLALLPPGWRPGQPLPANLPDVSTLLASLK